MTVNNTTTRMCDEPTGQTVVAAPALTTNVNRCGVAEVSEMTNFTTEGSAPAPPNTVMLASKPVYYY